MTPLQHVAVRVVSLATAHSVLVTSDLHPGIDLARQLTTTTDTPETVAAQALVVGTCEVLEARYQRMCQLASIFA